MLNKNQKEKITVYDYSGNIEEVDDYGVAEIESYFPEKVACLLSKYDWNAVYLPPYLRKQAF